ncbi:MAG: putative methyltransferase YcgJ [Pseudomonadota bacterium]|jgi:SAM-dependent methyltransferase
MDRQRSTQFMLRLVGDVSTAMATALAFVGDEAGLFRAMAGAGPLSPDDLAGRAGVHPRYVAEWLAAMAGAGYVEHDAATDRFTLPDEHAVFLADPSAETYLGGLTRAVPGMAGIAPKLAEAFRSGRGLAFAEFGADLPVGLERMNRTVYEARLASTWLPTMTGVVERLQAGGCALDVGCGTGVAAIAIAKAFPAARVTGLDLDPHSIAIARGYAAEAGVADRVSFVVASAEAIPRSPAADGRWDLVSTFDVIHDLPDPDAALRAIRASLADGGSYLMVEPKVGDTLAENLGNPFARMLYGISCLHCVPQSLAQGGPALGACWGPAAAARRARDAGFGRFMPLPVRSPALAFYEAKAG